MAEDGALLRSDPSTRHRPALTLDHAGFLIIDVQNLCAKPGVGELAAAGAPDYDGPDRYYCERVVGTVIPNIKRLQDACRAAGVEVLFTVIESLTRDGRDRSLDYKLSNMHVPKGAYEARVVDEIAPQDDEIVIPKTASSVFNATNIDYVLRNLDIRDLIVAGVCTDQCVEGAVRDAADRGYLVTLVEDACATHSQAEHDAALHVLKGYARVLSTEAVIAEIAERKAQS